MSGDEARGRYWNAPAPFRDEAPSSWMRRVAHAHRLGVEELLQLRAASASELDLGLNERALAEISGMSPIVEWPRCHDVVQALQSAALLPDYRPQIPAAEWWAYCPECAAGDVIATAYIRSAWAQPLAFVCQRHACYLRPWPRDHELEFFDGRVMARASSAAMLASEEASDDDLAFSRLLLYPARRGWEPAAQATIDLADALFTRTGPNGADTVLLREFVPPEMLAQFPGSRRLCKNELCAQPANIRIQALRVVARWIYFRVPESGGSVPDWLRGIVDRRRRLHGRDLSWAAADPLFRVMTRLNSLAADQLAERSRYWPAELRMRMAAAVVVGAMANSA